MKRKLKQPLTIFSAILFVLLVAGLEWAGRWHFYMLEQYQLFPLTWDYFRQLATGPAGVLEWLKEFFVQFFVLPWAGPIIIAAGLTVLGLLTALICRRFVRSMWVWAAVGVLPVLGAVCLIFGLPKAEFSRSSLKKIDRLAALEDWDGIIVVSRDGVSDYISLAYLNLALAQKGVLGDEMFRFEQADTKGLIYPWDRSLSSAIVRSDTFFAIGMINGAQEMAFEGMVSAPGWGSARMLKRLVQTNLIYGEWRVAEKYIDLLSKTLFYRRWAEEHRRFLWNDAAVEADPLLGSRRRCLPDESRFFKTVYGDIELVVRQNPDNRAAMEYLGALALLSRDERFFHALIEAYYGTEYLPSLPRAWQEAVVLFNSDRREVWEHFGVAQYVLERFSRFAGRMSEDHDLGALTDMLRREFGDTYWYYHTFKQ